MTRRCGKGQEVMRAVKRTIRTDVDAPQKGDSPVSMRAEQDREADNIRPLLLKDYIGQERVKYDIATYIEAAKKNGRQLGHILLSGPPGLGKTTLARIVANEMGVGIAEVSGPSITKPGEIASMLMSLQDGGVAFIDEIHSLDSAAMEMLYSAMEDFKINITMGSENTAKSKMITVGTPRFTLIGATTKAGSLTKPLADRFVIKERMEYYTSDELAMIAKRSAAFYNVNIDDDGCSVIAGMSRGTPRVANGILYRLAAFSTVQNHSDIDAAFARETIRKMGIDDEGLDIIDRRMLRTIINTYGCGPVGIETLAATMEEDVHTLESMHEPYLLRNGYIERTPRGRIATQKAMGHIKTWSFIDDRQFFAKNKERGV